MKIIKGSISTPKGFLAHGLWSGIKRSGKLDLALIYSDVPAICAAVFTKNSIKAAPILVTMKKLKNNRAQAILVNSGNANCFTGNFGILYAQKSANLIARILNIDPEDVLVASTGIIGRPLPYSKIQNAAPGLVRGLGTHNDHKAAQAILTTDLKTKEVCVRLSLGGKTVTIGAIAKGSGMIAPNMATMLAFINTDVAINPGMLKLALKHAVEYSFNRITVDGCMSTNDMVSVMANGRSGNTPITSQGKDFLKFSEALGLVCLDLAQKIIRDAEGATKFIEIKVTGAPSEEQAKTAALAVANSNLVKTAAFGSDPNWGRVAAAVGSLGLSITEKQLKIKFSSFAKKNIHINVDLNHGKHSASVYTCDLSFDYVKINGQYN